MVLQHTMRPSIAHVSKQLDPWFAANSYITASISHTRFLPVDVSYYSFPIPLWIGDWVDWTQSRLAACSRLPVIRHKERFQL